MKAIVYETYGAPEVVQLREVEKPSPRAGEVLVEVRATTVSSGDARLRAMNTPAGFHILMRLVFGIFSPRRRILGTELSGVVTAVGAGVTRFAVGDPVVAAVGAGLGCHAEFRTVSEAAAIAHKPAALSFEEAAALSFGGMTALDFFRRGKLQSGERLLVNGASGAVGSAAVQLGKHLGAHVTGVCSGANVELVRSLGADAVIDYTQADFTHNGEVYDVVMDTVGTAPYPRSKRSLAPGGRLLLVAATLRDMLASLWLNLVTDKTVVAGPSGERLDDLELLVKLATEGKYKPVVDKTFPLERTAEAHAHVDTGHKRGSVVLTVTPGT